MFCLHCGISLPDDANFCRRCGAPQRACLSRPKDEPLSLWEICRITTEAVTAKRTWRGARVNLTERFRADAVGPDGPYLAATSLAYDTWAGRPARRQTEDSRRAARDALIQQLLGEHWFPRSDDLFIRRVK